MPRLRLPSSVFFVVAALLLATGCGRSQTYRPKPVPVIPPPPVKPPCNLVLQTLVLDFGTLDANASKVLVARVRNTGAGPCEASLDKLTGGPSFSLVGSVPAVTLQSGDEFSFKVQFAPGPAVPPAERTGTAVIATTDKLHPSFTVQLKGKVKLCDLHVTPSPLDFGNVTLNAKATAHLTLANLGTSGCLVSRVAFGPNTDPNFSFPAPPMTISLAPSASAQVQLDFRAIGSAPPYQRSGSVQVSSDDPVHPELIVPLSAFVSTICTQAGQYIYTVDGTGMFSRFDPVTLTSLDIGMLNCPGIANPFSMNVDQSGIAWIIFDDGNLFRVDTANAACTATSYVPSQLGFFTFGMGSVFDSSTGKDTLYLAASPFNATASQLGTLAYPSLTVTQVATVPIGWVELAGTGDGQLWGYAPHSSFSGGPLLFQMNRATGAVIDRYDVPEITTVGGFAVKFFGGSFFVFVGADVWKIERSALLPGKTIPTKAAVRVLTTPGLDVVGAGVSTCAPVQN